MSYPVCEDMGMNLKFDVRIAGFGTGKPNPCDGVKMPRRTGGRVNNSFLFELIQAKFWTASGEKQNSGVTAFDI
jgi:hypothetical protein